MLSSDILKDQSVQLLKDKDEPKDIQSIILGLSPEIIRPVLIERPRPAL
jgi:hypothetical protein